MWFLKTIIGISFSKGMRIGKGLIWTFPFIEMLLPVAINSNCCLNQLQQSTSNLNFRPLCIILFKIQDLKVGVQEHKTPILSLFFYHFEVLCFHTQTQIHINFSFNFGRGYRKVQEKGWTEKNCHLRTRGIWLQKCSILAIF